jgi:hypothetical protein
MSVTDNTRLMGAKFGSYAVSWLQKPKSDWDITGANKDFANIKNPQFIECNSGRYCIVSQSEKEFTFGDCKFHIVEVFGWDKSGIPVTQRMYLNSDGGLLSQEETKAEDFGDNTIDFGVKLKKPASEGRGISINEFNVILKNNKSDDIKNKLTDNKLSEIDTKKTYALGSSKYTAEIDSKGGINFYKGVGNKREQICSKEGSIDGQLFVALNDLLTGKIKAHETPPTSIRGVAAIRVDNGQSSQLG